MDTTPAAPVGDTEKTGDASAPRSPPAEAPVAVGAPRSAGTFAGPARVRDPRLPGGAFKKRVLKLVAEDKPALAAEFAAQLDKAAHMAVRVGLVRDTSARVLLVNTPKAKSLGLAPDGAHPRVLRKHIEDSYGLRAARPGETPTHWAIATQYRDFGAHGVGAVRGDGRAGILESALVVDAAGRVVGVSDIQLKGFPTGLAPQGEGAQAWHGHGLERVVVAVMDAIYSDYQVKSGMSANTWLAVMATDGLLPEHKIFYDAGLTVRAGSFLRLAHFQFLKDDPAALRELVDLTNDEACLRIGRQTRMPIAGLAAHLIDAKARNLAAQYWNRIFHGSVSYDNTGIFESIDQGTMGAMDRTHPSPPPEPGDKNRTPGFTEEPHYVLGELIGDTFMELLYTAGKDSEKRALTRMKPARFVKKIFERRMAAHMLEHLGCGDVQVRALLRKEPDAVRALQAQLEQIGSIPEPKHIHVMGPALNDRAHPARFDIFQALSVLVEVVSSGVPREEQVARVARALEPQTPAGLAEACTHAERLIDATAPLVPHLPVAVVIDQARRINRRVDALERNHVMNLARRFVDRSKDARSLEQGRAELMELGRSVHRRGPASALDVADRITQRHLVPDESGVFTLRSTEENHVLIHEHSDGVRDFITLELTHNPMGLDDVGRSRFEMLAPDGSWQVLPTERVGDVMRARVEPVPARLVVRARSDNGSHLWDNAGHGFGRGLEPLVHTAIVDDALRAHCARHGVTRAPAPAPAPSLVGTKLPRRWLDEYFADESVALAKNAGWNPKGAGNPDRMEHLRWAIPEGRVALCDNLKKKIDARLQALRRDPKQLARYYSGMVMRHAALGIPAWVPHAMDRGVHEAWARSVPFKVVRAEMMKRIDGIFDAYDDVR